jgi:uncharacterized protein YndB with AHSA1/START domain
MAGHTVRAQRDIIAEPAEVWAVITDLERLARTLHSVDSIERVAGTGFAPGVSWRETRRMMGKLDTEEMTVVEVVPPRLVVLHAQSKGSTYETRYELAPSSLGSRLAISFGAETSQANAGQKLAWAVLGPLGGKAAKSALEKDLEDIALAVEANYRR